MKFKHLIAIIFLTIGIFTYGQKINTGTFVGKVIAFDQDKNDRLTYEIVSGNTIYKMFQFGDLTNGPNNYLNINQGDTTGNIYIRNGRAVYYPSGEFRYNQLTIKIRVTDRKGLSKDAKVTISFTKGTMAVRKISKSNH